VRILFTTQPGAGHLHPLVPVIHALTDAGHEVAVACPPSFAATVEASGVRAIAAGFDWAPGARLAPLFPESENIPSGPERVAWMITRIFAGITAERMATAVLAIAAEWPLDLVVRESLEFGGCLAAERLGLPHAVVQTVVNRAGVAALLVEPLNRQRERLGLPPDPDLAMPNRYLHLSPRPPSLQGTPLAPSHHSYRASVFDRSVVVTLPDWMQQPMAEPVIFATLGTVNNLGGQELFAAIIEGVGKVAGTLILAVGADVDPAILGPQPAHIRVERYIPQSLIFPHCDLVIAHGGSATLIAAVSHGLPLVVIPIAADQPDNAALVAAHRLGRVIGPGERTVEAIEAATRNVLEDPSYRENAHQVRDEIAALPGPEYAVELLERLARERAPILAQV
jgi:UDP:flavonoid glycosyltransferase YjiC (YdhE family)